MQRLIPALVALFKESLIVYWALMKIMVPVMIAVEIAMRAGIVDVISEWSAPAMVLFGLPAEASILLATNLLVGIYPAAIVLIALAPEVSFSVADMTIIGGMMLFAHALPIEQLIVKKTGVSFIFSNFSRLFAMCVYGLLAHHIIEAAGVFQEPATILLAIDVSNMDESWLGWIISSLQSLALIFLILVGLITLLKVLDKLGITKWLMKALTPLLRLIGIGPNAAPLAMVGILLGLSFGGGLIMREVDKGVLKPKSVFISMIFIGFCHSLIEDTLLILAFGAHWSGVLVGRIVLSVLLILPISFIVLRMSDKHFEFVYSKKKAMATS